MLLDRHRLVNYKCLNDNRYRFGPEILRDGYKVFAADFESATNENNLI